MKSVRMIMAMALLGIAPLLLWGAAPGREPATGAAGAGGNASYRDPVNGFTMLAPSFATAAKERTVVVTFQGTPKDGFASNVNVLIDPVKKGREEYMAEALDSLKKDHPQANMRSNKTMEVSGKEAQLLDFDASMGGKRLRFLQLFVFAEDRVYIVTCTAPLATFGASEADFRRCLETFRVE